MALMSIFALLLEATAGAVERRRKHWSVGGRILERRISR